MIASTSRRTRLLGSTALVPALALSVGSLAMPGAALAQSEWDGETDSDWATGANWNPNAVPGAGTIVIVNNGAAANQPVVNTNQTAALTTIGAGSVTVNANLTSTVVTLDTGVVRINAGGQIIGDVLQASSGTSGNAGTINGTLTITDGVFDNAGAVTGATAITAGTLNLNAGSDLSDTELLTITGGTVNVNTNETVGGLSGSGGILNISTGNRFVSDQAVDTTFAGAITGTHGLNVEFFRKEGSGTLTLSGQNTASGGRMFVTGGRLVLQGGNAIGDGAVLEVASGTAELQADEVVGGLLGAAAGTLDIGGNTLTVAGVSGAAGTLDELTLAGTGTLLIDHAGFTTTMDGTHSFTGLYQVSAGTLGLGGAGSASASLLVDGGTLSLAANRSFAAVTLASGAITGAGTLTSTSDFDVQSGSISATLTGTVGLDKTTAGTVTLSGANTYTGLTTVSQGTLVAANGGALGSTAAGTTVSDGATLAIDGGITLDEDITLNGVGVGGGGALRNLGGDNLLTGDVTLASAATITSSAGRLQIDGTVDNGGNLLTTNGSGTTVFAGVISGSGGLTKTGSGTTELSGANTYTGVTTVGAGVLLASNGAAIADSGEVVVNGGSFVIGADETIGSLAGTGGFVTTAANIGTTTLTVGTNDLSTSFAGDLRDNGTGLFALAKTGAGTLTLTGASTFTGGTTINAGTIALGTGDGLGTGIITIADGAALQLGLPGGSDVTLANDIVLSGGSAQISGPGGVRSLSLSGTPSGTALVRLDGAISGTGALNLTGDTVFTINGDNTYLGGTTLDDVFVVLGSDTAFGDGAITMSGLSGLFNASAGSTRTLSNDIGGGSFLVGGPGDLVLDGVISAGFEKFGSGVLRLNNAANSFNGFTINGGTVAVGTDGAIGSGLVTLALSGTLQAAVADLILTNDAAIAAGQTLTLDTQGFDLTFAGDTSLGGALRKAGSGTLTLSGVNSHTGGTTIAGGRLIVEDQDAAGSGAYALNSGTVLQIGQVGTPVSVTLGNVVLNGAGTVDLNGTATAFDLTSAAPDGSSVVFGGSVTGTGGLSVIGAGRLRFGGNLAGFSGGLTLGGTLPALTVLDLNANGAGTGAITISGGMLSNSSGAAVTLNNAINAIGPAYILTNNDLTLNGPIGGTFSIRKLGSGTLTLGNDGGRGFQLDAGTLRATASNGLGDAVDTQDGTTIILDGTGLTFDAIITQTGTLAIGTPGAGRATLSGSISGAGLINKTGTGLLILTGISNGFTGATAIRAGELRVNGELRSSVVTLSSGATLSGTGVIGGLVAQSGSTVSPGNSPGTLTVNGNIDLQAGSTVQFGVNATGLSDLILATGTASLNGTAALTNLGGNHAFGSEIVLLQANGGRTGTFAATTGLAGFGNIYRPELIYTANQVRLRFVANQLTNIVGTTPLTANQRSVVSRIDGAVTAGFNPQPLFNVFNLPTAQLPGAFDQLSGEVYASAAGVGIEQERLVREAVLGRLASLAMAGRAQPEAVSGFGAWGQLYGGWGDGESDGNAAAFDTDRMGFVTGLDYGTANENGGWRVGLFGMQVQSDVTLDARGSAAEVEQTGGGAYAAFNTGGFGVSLGGYASEIDLRTFRDIALPGFVDSTVGTTEGKARQAFAELSYTIAAGDGQIRPFVAGSVGSFRLDALTETGGAAALTMREQRYETATVTGGFDAGVPIGKRLRLDGTLAARAQLGDRDPQALLALAAAPQQAFAIDGAQLDKVALAARLETVFAVEENLSISLGYSGLIGSTQTDHTARATVQMQF